MRSRWLPACSCCDPGGWGRAGLLPYSTTCRCWAPPRSVCSWSRRRCDRARSRHERLAALTEPECSVARGVPVTGLARTVVDLSRSEGRRGGVVLADAALRRGLEPAELAWVVQQSSTWPGATRAGAVACFADGRSESVHESVSRVVLAELGLPAPEPQVEVWLDGVLLGRVDFLWKDRRTVGEADGMAKYVDRGSCGRRSCGRRRSRTSGFRSCAGAGRRAGAGPATCVTGCGVRSSAAATPRLLPACASCPPQRRGCAALHEGHATRLRRTPGSGRTDRVLRRVHVSRAVTACSPCSRSCRTAGPSREQTRSHARKGLRHASRHGRRRRGGRAREQTRAYAARGG